MPKSYATTRNRSSPTAAVSYASSVDTRPVRSRPAIDGCDSRRSRSSSSGTVRAPMAARMAPAERMWRVSARVSTSERATTPLRIRYDRSDSVARQPVVTGEISRITNPATCARDDSSSSGVTP